MANITSAVTGKNLNANNVAITKAGGALIKGNEVGTFTYIPGKDVTYAPSTKAVSIAAPKKSLPAGSKPTEVDNTTQELVQKVAYDFGIDAIVARYTSPKATSGFMSQPIKLGPCSYVTLSVKAEGALDGRMEFSIVDGSAETPIIPEEMDSQIMHEKLFPGLPTRFSIDTSKACVVCKNNAQTKLTYEEVQKMPLDDGEYDISYFPKSDYKYFPTNSSIMVKAVVRCSDGKPAPIKAMTIKRFGGDMPWHTSD